MANKLKNKKSQRPDPDKLKPEKEEPLQVKQLVKDERTHKIAGSLFVVLALFLFIAFTSYLFTWQEDQDKVFKGGIQFLFSDNIKVANLLGRLGAWAAHLFIYSGFGLASFLICSFFFVLGSNLLFNKKIFSIKRNLRYVLTGLIFFSVAFAFVSPSNVFPWGGAVGDMLNNWLQRFLGCFGTAVLLSLAGHAYFIWLFNPIFYLPQKKISKNNSNVYPGWEENDPGKTANAEEELETHPNYLKSEGGIVLMPPSDPKKHSINELKIVEKEDRAKELNKSFPPIIELPPDDSLLIPNSGSGLQRANGLDIDLEVNPPHEDEEKIGEVKTEQLQPYEPTLDLRDYKYPSLDLLENPGSDKIIQDASELEANKNQIINTLKNYDISIQKISATIGPTVTLYEIVPAAGVRISRIKNLEDDIALSLAALGIRIIAPIPGKGTIGIEVPNVKKTVVSMRTLLSSEKFQHNNFNLPIALGKKIDNENFIVDLTTMPHLLMAGATGQGKSVGINTILVSLLYKKHPSQLKFVLIDPKKVELSLYRVIEKHFLAKLPGEEESIITDTKKVVYTLNALCIEMDN